MKETCLDKMEVLRTGPEKRYLDGVCVEYMIKEKKIIYTFKKESSMLAIDMLLYMTEDPSMDVINLEFNGEIVYDISEKNISTLEPRCSISNKLILNLKSERDVVYEMGCIIYKKTSEDSDILVAKILDT